MNKELQDKNDRKTLRELAELFPKEERDHLISVSRYGTNTEVFAKIYEADEKLSRRIK